MHFTEYFNFYSRREIIKIYEDNNLEYDKISSKERLLEDMKDKKIVVSYVLLFFGENVIYEDIKYNLDCKVKSIIELKFRIYWIGLYNKRINELNILNSKILNDEVEIQEINLLNKLSDFEEVKNIFQIIKPIIKNYLSLKIIESNMLVKDLYYEIEDKDKFIEILKQGKMTMDKLLFKSQNNNMIIRGFDSNIVNTKKLALIFNKKLLDDKLYYINTEDDIIMKGQKEIIELSKKDIEHEVIILDEIYLDKYLKKIICNIKHPVLKKYSNFI